MDKKCLDYVNEFNTNILVSNGLLPSIKSVISLYDEKSISLNEAVKSIKGYLNAYDNYFNSKREEKIYKEEEIIQGDNSPIEFYNHHNVVDKMHDLVNTKIYRDNNL